MLSQEKILINRLMGPEDNRQGLFKLVLHGQIAEQAKPGQFVTLKTSLTNDPLLRRPLSIAGIDKKSGEITIYYRVKGPGTVYLARQPEGTYLDVLGPLGRGFTLPGSEAIPHIPQSTSPISLVQPATPSYRPPTSGFPSELFLVAGGIGIFALYSLLEYTLKNKLTEKMPVTVIWGGLDRGFLECATTDLLYQLPKNNVLLCTMDGSFAYKGLVTEPLEQILSAGKSRDTLVAACGPKAMLKAVAELCGKYYVQSEICLEEYMACGLGACRGCVCQIRDSTGAVKNGRVCVEGPVFSGEEVVWHEQI